MSIDFFLQQKSICKQIEFHVTEIINLYEEFIDLMKQEEILENKAKLQNVSYLNQARHEYCNKQKELIFLKQHIDNMLKTHCNHEYEKDLIDITPDTSREIEYCTLCGHTK